MAKWKVLLVDDEVEFVSALAERLQIRGIDARATYSGEEALDAIERDVPQVVVLDMMMPGLGGMEVLRRVKAAHPRVRVIFLTGQGCPVQPVKGGAMGAFECLMKPLDIDELVKSIGDAVAEAGAEG